MTNIDSNPVFASCVAVSSIAIRTTLGLLLEELQVALNGYDVDWSRFELSLEELDFMTTQPHGNQFTALVQLRRPTPFYFHPVNSQLGVAAVVYGQERSLRSTKTYSARYSVQISPIASASELACSSHFAAVVWGSDGAVSEQLQHLVLYEHAAATLSPDDRSKIMLITSRVVVPNVRPTLRMSMTVCYLLSHNGNPKEESKRLQVLLFGKEMSLSVHGIPFVAFASPEEALALRPKCKSLTLCNALSVSGLNLSAPVNEVVETLLLSGAMQLRAVVWVYTVRNFSAKGKDLRYLIILGQAFTGQLNMNHIIFKPISTKGDFRYDLRITAGELFGQPELRLAHQGVAPTNIVKYSAPTPSTALVKSTAAPKDNSTGWASLSLRRQTTQDTTSTQLSSGLLALHSEEIKHIQQSIKGLEEKLDQHDQVLRNVATKSDIDSILAKYLGHLKPPV